MEKLIHAGISALFFGLAIFIIKRDLGRLAAKLDELADKHYLCRESLPRDYVPARLCRDHRREEEDKISNVFARLKTVEERTSRLNGVLAAGARKRE